MTYGNVFSLKKIKMKFSISVTRRSWLGLRHQGGAEGISNERKQIRRNTNTAASFIKYNMNKRQGLSNFKGRSDKFKYRTKAGNISPNSERKTMSNAMQNCFAKFYVGTARGRVSAFLEENIIKWKNTKKYMGNMNIENTVAASVEKVK